MLWYVFYVALRGPRSAPPHLNRKTKTKNNQETEAANAIAPLSISAALLRIGTILEQLNTPPSAHDASIAHIRALKRFRGAGSLWRDRRLELHGVVVGRRPSCAHPPTPRLILGGYCGDALPDPPADFVSEARPRRHLLRSRRLIATGQ